MRLAALSGEFIFDCVPTCDRGSSFVSVENLFGGACWTRSPGDCDHVRNWQDFRFQARGDSLLLWHARLFCNHFEYVGMAFFQLAIVLYIIRVLHTLF